MAHFISTSALEIGEDGKWLLVNAWMYKSDALLPAIRIPKGFETDLASIPRIFTPLITKNGKHRRAAIVHDYLYSVRGRLPSGEVLNRKQCDDLFREALSVCGVKRWKRWAMHAAVRSGGWVFWRKAV